LGTDVFEFRSGWGITYELFDGGMPVWFGLVLYTDGDLSDQELLE
jgi:hypothetical protein